MGRVLPNKASDFQRRGSGLARQLPNPRKVFCLLWQRRCFKEGNGKVAVLLARQELFQSDGAAREKGRSCLAENKRSKCQGCGGTGEGRSVGGARRCLVQWRKGTQGGATKRNGMVVAGAARRCGPHRGLEAGLERVKVAFMRGEKQNGEAERCPTSSVRYLKEETPLHHRM